MIRKKTGLKEVTILVLASAALVSVACGDDDAIDGPGASGSAGSSTAGTKSSGGSAGTSTGGTTSAGTNSGGDGSGATAGAPIGGDGAGGVPTEGGTGSGGEPVVGGAGGADVGGAGGEGGEPPIVFDTLKNVSFEQGNPGGNSPPDSDTSIFPEWTNTSSVAGASVIKWGDFKSGQVRLGQWNNVAYTARVEQTVSPIPNGTYSFSIWVMRGDDTVLNDSYIYAVGHDAAAPNEPIEVGTDPAIGGTYVKITLADIEVTNGQVTVGMYTDANAGGWVNFDDAELVLQPE